VDARLLVADRSDLRGGKELVEVSHEALIRSWAELRRWVDEDRELLRTRRRVEEARSAWAAEGRKPDRLLQPGRPLGEAEELVERRPDFADRDLRAYIAASRSRARRAARGRRLVAAGAVALAVVASLAAWAAKQSRDQAERQRIVAEENRALAEDRSRSLEAALAEARAHLIWSSLELRTDPLGPAEVDALWQLAAAGHDVRRAFVRQLDENRSSVLKLVRRPAPVLRALGLVLPAEEARALLRPLLRAFDDTADPSTLAALARAVRAVPARLTREQAEAALRPVLGGFRRTNDPYALQALVEAAGALPVRLTAEQEQVALGSVLGALGRTMDPYALHALATAAQALPLRLPGEQARAALEPILAGFARTSDSYALRALAQAAQALQVRLAGEQVEAALVPILRGFRSTDDPYALQALAEATRSVAAGLTGDRAQVALAPILGGFGRTNDPYALQALAEAAAALPVWLSSAQAEAALGPVLAASRDNSEAESLQALALAVRALAPNLEAERAQALLGPVLDTLKKDARPASLPLLVQAAKALVPSLPVEAEMDALRLARSGLAGARSGAEAVAWAAAFEATLPPAGGYLGSVVEALKYPTSVLDDRKAGGDAPTSAEEYLLRELRALPAAQGLRATGLDGVLAWIAERHPEIDLTSPPARPAPVDRAIVADQAR
jgi:hypothetical protein